MTFEESELLLQGISQPLHTDMWYLDIGATSHMTGNLSLFFNLDMSYKGNVKFGDDSRISIEGHEDILLFTKNGNRVKLSNVLYTPNLKANILSLGRLDE